MPYLYIETKKAATLILQGFKDFEIKDMSIKENIFQMKSYSVLNMEELEQLATVGGSDIGGITTDSAVASTIGTTIAVSEAVSTVVSLIGGLSVAASTLYSCTANTKVCTRKKEKEEIKLLN